LIRIEIGLVIGATETLSVGEASGDSIKLNSSIALGAEYDRKVLGKHTPLLIGADFLASPADVKVSYPAPLVSPEYASLFVSPRVKVKFSSTAPLQPWLSFGGGYADFSPASPRSGNVNVKGQGDSGTFEFGGGVDARRLIRFKGVPLLKYSPIGARFEVRDFYSGRPHYGVGTRCGFQNNVAFTGGPADSVLATSLEDEVEHSCGCGTKTPTRLASEIPAARR
jgi:hypothetical protein